MYSALQRNRQRVAMAFALIGVIISLLLLSARGFAEEPIETSPDETRSMQYQCGQNCLYMLLRAYGKSLSFDDVAHNLLLGEKGVSLLELRNAAERLGLPCEVRRCDPNVEELARFPLPILVHLSKYHANVSTGHYVLVYKAVPTGEGSGVWFVDSIDGKKVRFRPEAIPEFWSGYALVPKRTGANLNNFSVFVSCLLWFLVVAAAVIEYRKRKGTYRSRAVHSFHNQALCLITFALCLVSTAGRAQPVLSADKVYRAPQKDGVNSLYMLLRLNGIELSYNELELAVKADFDRLSLQSLAEVAQKFGLRPRIIRCAPADLREIGAPMILHMYDNRQEGGRFALIYAIPKNDNGKYGTVDAGLVCLSELSADEFRRTWSGLTLVAVRKNVGWRAVGACNLFLLAVYFWQRSGREPLGSPTKSAAKNMMKPVNSVAIGA